MNFFRALRYLPNSNRVAASTLPMPSEKEKWRLCALLICRPFDSTSVWLDCRLRLHGHPARS
jgi:hypothetical protein